MIRNLDPPGYDATDILCILLWASADRTEAAPYEVGLLFGYAEFNYVFLRK